MVLLCVVEGGTLTACLQRDAAISVTPVCRKTFIHITTSLKTPSM